MRRRPDPRPRAAALAAALVAAPAGAAAGAQPTTTGALTLDAGVARVHQAGAPGITAPSAGVGIAFARGAAAYRADAAVAAAEGRGAAQLEAAAGRAVATLGRAALRADAEVRAARVPNSPWATLALAGLRADMPLGAGGGAAAGGWARGQAGFSRRLNESSPSAAGEVGVWRAAGAGGRVVLALSAATARVSEDWLVAAGVNAFGPGRVATGDLAAAYERVTTGSELVLAAGVRGYAPRSLRALPPDDADSTDPGAPLRWRAQASAAAVAWLTPGLGLAGAVGIAPNDPVRGLPAAGYLTVGLRLRAVARGRTVLPSPAPAPDGRPGRADRDAPPGVGALEVGTAPGGDAAAARRVAVRAPAAARRVQLRGDVTGWRPLDLARGPDGAWAAGLALAAGAHRVQLRVDDGPWAPPGNLPAVDDELAGPAGLLVVP